MPTCISGFGACSAFVPACDRRRPARARERSAVGLRAQTTPSRFDPMTNDGVTSLNLILALPGVAQHGRPCVRPRTHAAIRPTEGVQTSQPDRREAARSCACGSSDRASPASQPSCHAISARCATKGSNAVGADLLGCRGLGAPRHSALQRRHAGCPSWPQVTHCPTPRPPPDCYADDAEHSTQHQHAHYTRGT